jgi:hypothetical protein
MITKLTALGTWRRFGVTCCLNLHTGWIYLENVTGSEFRKLDLNRQGFIEQDYDREKGETEKEEKEEMVGGQVVVYLSTF